MRSIKSLIFIRLFCIILIFFMVVSGFAYFLTGAIRQFAVSDSSTALSFIVNNIEANYKSELKTIDQIASLHGFSPYDEQEARGNEFANLSADEAAILVGMHLSYLKRSELFPRWESLMS